MYDPNNNNPFGITRDESLWDKLTYERFLKIANDKDVKIVSSTRDDNSYGEFHFITLTKKQGNEIWHLMVYGMGYHEHRQTNITDMCIGECNPHSTERWKKTQGLAKGPVLATLESEYVEYSEKAKTDDPDENALLYGELADLTDDDGAMAEFDLC